MHLPLCCFLCCFSDINVVRLSRAVTWATETCSCCAFCWQGGGCSVEERHGLVLGFSGRQRRAKAREVNEQLLVLKNLLNMFLGGCSD